MLMAMGATVIELGLMRLHRFWRGTVQAVYLIALTAWGLYVCTSILPLASNGPARDRDLENNGDLREEIGWNEMVKTVATIWESLPSPQRGNVSILVGNYGEQGAIEILGPAYHLPPPITGTNSGWFRGYPNPPPSMLIVLGHSRGFVVGVRVMADQLTILRLTWLLETMSDVRQQGIYWTGISAPPPQYGRLENFER